MRGTLPAVPRPPKNPTLGKLLGRGNNGAAFRLPTGVVAKYTQDPVEIRAFLAGLTAQNLGIPFAGLPPVHDLLLGDREAVVLREDVRPVVAKAGVNANYVLASAQTGALQTGCRYEAASRLCQLPTARRYGRRAIWNALEGDPRFQGVRDTLRAVERAGTLPRDIRPANLAWGPPPRAPRRGDRALSGQQFVLFDPGRSPLETLVVGRGEFGTRCPNEATIRQAVQQLLGRGVSYRTCRVVEDTAIRAAMRRHGWRDAEIDGTAGFHAPSGELLVRRGEEWAVLHEIVHGAISHGLATWLLEGLTEAVAQEVARVEGWSHTPTYPLEVKTVREKVCPMLGLSVLELGRLVAASGRGASKVLAGQLAQRVPTPGLPPRVDAAHWERLLAPGSGADSRAFLTYVKGRNRRTQ